MKPITIRFWVPEETPDLPLGNYGKVPTAEIIALATTAEGTLLTDKEITSIADGIGEREYRETVAGIVEDLKRAVADGEITDRDGAIEWLEQTIDGHHDVIYTHCAQEILPQRRCVLRGLRGRRRRQRRRDRMVEARVLRAPR
jgi:hypothetical protein